MEIIRSGILFLLLSCAWVTAAQDAVSSEVFVNTNGETVMHCWCTTLAPVDSIWRAIASSDGLARWAAPAAHVELRIGGSYELYFRPDQPKGKRGMEGNRILSYNVNRMLSYSGGLPDTWVVYSIESAREASTIHFHAMGTHPEWVSKCREQTPAVASFIQKLCVHLNAGR